MFHHPQSKVFCTLQIVDCVMNVNVVILHSVCRNVSITTGRQEKNHEQLIMKRNSISVVPKTAIKIALEITILNSSSIVLVNLKVFAIAYTKYNIFLISLTNIYNSGITSLEVPLCKVSFMFV